MRGLMAGVALVGMALLGMALLGIALVACVVPVRAQDFDREVRPLLVRRCLECHSGPEPKGKLDVTAPASLGKGGRSGPAVVAGDLETSWLWARIEAGEMPPKNPLSANEKKLIRAWIERGARWSGPPLDLFAQTTERRAGRDWWSLEPVTRPELPGVKDKRWPRQAIDFFVLARLEASGLPPAPEADPRTLIRRVTFDLIGLPPTPQEVETFVADPRPDAYERLVDRLLASPHFGERWARHWLDVVRFGESNGFEHDELRPSAWPYRDWVIDALNRDLPYDEFVRLQIAGDVLRPAAASGVVATGFLVAGGYDSVGQKQQSAAMKAVVRQDELEDMLGTVGQTFLGLTVHCARCHDHKFDPIRQSEYYQLTAALAGVHPGERVVKDLADGAPPSGGKVYAVAPTTPEPTFLLIRGEPGRRGPAVTPGGLQALGAADFGLPADSGDGQRRRALAEWLTRPENPLLARVMVNRLWQHHFGVGIVDTPSDFGFNGGRPSHPELLDWLAHEFRNQGFSLKSMHRLIVTSAAYRQASRFRAEAARVDAGNRLLWRKSPMRLEAEAVRDAILAVAGKLNAAPGGPGYQDFKVAIRGATYYYPRQESDASEQLRRSIYRTWVRSGRNPLLDTLDCPDPSTVTPRRTVTTTPLQALSLLNSDFVLRMAEHWARRVEGDVGADVAAQIRRAYVLALGRLPSDEELTAARPEVARHGLGVLCRALLNSNEFLYLD